MGLQILFGRVFVTRTGIHFARKRYDSRPRNADGKKERLRHCGAFLVYRAVIPGVTSLIGKTARAE